FGWTGPIVVDENWNIIAGYGRYKAAMLLNLRKVPVLIVTGLNETEKRALALGDNKIASNAGWDREILAAELGDLAKLLPEFDLNLEITGFEAPEVDSLLTDLVDSESDPADEVPAVEKISVSRTGDLWLLGKHRLLCGDSTQAASVLVVLGVERITMV